MSTKTKSTSTGTKQRMTVKEYRSKLNEAYNSGYKDGWNAHEKLPSVCGSRTAAKCGYANGLKNHKKSDNYRNKAK